MAAMFVRIPESLYRLLRLAAADQGRPLAEIVTIACREKYGFHYVPAPPPPSPESPAPSKRRKKKK